ncbi:MAG: SCP-like extracellular [Azospirillum sp.]|nr:SCP-like extracellular [Azospirillum sp.]
MTSPQAPTARCRRLSRIALGSALLIAASVGAQAGQSAEPPGRLGGIVEAHNHWRAEVGVPTLAWSRPLAELARNWAGQLQAEGCRMHHRPDNRYGENLAWAQGKRLSAAEVVGLWAGERKDYDHARNRCTPSAVCGHYTQLVWAKTRAVGCAVATCGDSEIWVCNYDPPGNYLGQRPY